MTIVVGRSGKRLNFYHLEVLLGSGYELGAGLDAIMGSNAISLMLMDHPGSAKARNSYQGLLIATYRNTT